MCFHHVIQLFCFDLIRPQLTAIAGAMDHPLYHKTYHAIQEIQQHFQQLSQPDSNLVENEILTKIAAVNA